jgi:nitrate reductase gamma subunit
VETVYYIVLVPMVYLAFAVFIIGTIFRFFKVVSAPPNPSPLNIFPKKRLSWLRALGDAFLFPTVRRHKPVLWGFLIVFHVMILLLIIGHIELFRDFSLFQIIEHDIFLGHGFVGLVFILCLVYFILRRFKSPVRELSVPEDYMLLLLLLLTALFGSQLDWGRTWYYYGELTPEDYREYLTSMILFRPEVPFSIMSTGHSFMLVLHVFFANLFLMFFPFSHLIHAIFSIPMNRLRRG